MIFIQCINILGLIVYIPCDKQWGRYFNHFVWLFLIIITVISFIVGAFSGMVGLISQDLVPVFNFIFSNNNLLHDRYIIKNKPVADFINVCLNGDGNIGSQLFNLENTDFRYLSKLYLYSSLINSSNITRSGEMDEILNKLENKKDTTLCLNQKDVVGNSNPNSATSMLERMNYYSNSSNYIGDTNCNITLYDIWVLNPDDCDSDANFITGMNPNSMTGQKTCMNLVDWNDYKLNIRYDGLSSCKMKNDKNFTDAFSAIMTYFKNLYDYDSTNKDNLNLMIDDMRK
jgi:hypothetical protein